MSSIPKVLVPFTVDSTVMTASSIAEPAAGETAWVSGGTYVVGDLRILTTTHRVYKCSLGHTGRTGTPDSATEAAFWTDWAPTMRYAAYDTLTSTKSTGVTSASWTLLFSQFINSVAIYGLTTGTTSARVVVKEGAGGATAYDQTNATIFPGLGFWEYYHLPPEILQKTLFQNIPLVLNPEVTITLTGQSGATVGCGMVAIGDMRPLIDTITWGGTQFGAQAKPTTYSYIKTEEDGTTTIVRRNFATDMSIKVEMEHGQADRALATLQEVLDVPAAWIGTDEEGYSGLNVFGLASGTLTYESYNYDIFTIDVKGFI